MFERTKESINFIFFSLTFSSPKPEHSHTTHTNSSSNSVFSPVLPHAQQPALHQTPGTNEPGSDLHTFKEALVLRPR